MDTFRFTRSSFIYEELQVWASSLEEARLIANKSEDWEELDCDCTIEYDP